MKGKNLADNLQRDTGNLIRMPWAEDAEKAVLSALIIESSAINQIVDILNPEMFYDSRHEAIYRSILSMYDKNIRIDLISLNKELEESGKIRDSGGIKYLLEITGIVYSASNIENHALYVKEKYIQRRLIEAGHNIQTSALDNSNDISDILEYSAKEIEDIMSGAVNESNTVSIGEAANIAYEKYLERNNAYLIGEKFNITSGFLNIDKYTGGFNPGDLIILAARPAMGKTAVLLHMAKSVAEQGKHPVIFSLEMTRDSLASRLFFSYQNIDTNGFKTGKLDSDGKNKLYYAKEYVSRLPITINDSSNISIRKIKNIALQLRKKGKCDVIYIDYLQLIDMRNENRSYNREQEVAQVSRQCKIMAKELDIPVILLSQLNRECERRADKTPLLSDLRESGAVEQDADTIIFIHRPEYYDDPGKEVGGEIVESGKGSLIIAKNRNGTTGKINFYYDETLCKIYDDKQDSLPF